MKLAHKVNLLIKVEQDASHKLTPVPHWTKSEEINTTVMHAQPAPHSKFQILQELLVLPDHLSTVDVWAEEIPPDINALTALLDKFKTQITPTNALVNKFVINSHTD